MKHWWQNLQVRERCFMIMGGSLAATFFLYLWILAPFVSKLQNLHQLVKENHELIRWMQPRVQVIQQLRASGIQEPRASYESLQMTVTNSIQENELEGFLSQIKESNQQVELQFNSVPFDRLIHWLKVLWEEYAITATTVTITSQPTSGLVQADLILQKTK